MAPGLSPIKGDINGSISPVCKDGRGHLHLQPGLCLVEPLILQTGCVGGKRTGSKEEMSKEEGKRGS